MEKQANASDAMTCAPFLRARSASFKCEASFISGESVNDVTLMPRLVQDGVYPKM